MKGRTAALALLFAFAGSPLFAETIVDYNITEDTTWTTAGSPYIIALDPAVEVKFGSTLTIEPGVEVRFEDGRALDIAPGEGSIVALGAPGDSIVFTSNDPSPTSGAWQRINVLDSPASQFSHCVFRYGEYGLRLIDSDPPVTSCAFRECRWGIWCDRSSSPAIEHCSITATDYAIWCRGTTEAVPTPLIYDCNLMGNAENVRLRSYSTPATIVAEHNWWGTDVESEIEASIFHDVDDPSCLGHVDYDPWLSEQPTGRSSWGRIKALFRG